MRKSHNSEPGFHYVSGRAQAREIVDASIEDVVERVRDANVKA